VNIAAKLSAPRGANALSVAEKTARGRARLERWRAERGRQRPHAFFPEPRPPADPVGERMRVHLAEDGWGALAICDVDDAADIVLEHRRWAAAHGVSFADLYASINGSEVPHGLTGDDVFAMLMRAYLAVQRSAP
jgi:hypothetical protein